MSYRLILAGILCLGCLLSPVRFEELFVDHSDELTLDEGLSLKQLVDITFERYPRNALVAAYQDEAQAPEQRSSSWVAGYPMLYLQYIDAERRKTLAQEQLHMNQVAFEAGETSDRLL